jgi:hypothetical protein
MKKIFFLYFFFLSLSLRADLVREPFEGVRPTGMGNAFIALADDGNALFYNPAALTKIKQVHVNFFNFTLGADSTDSLSRLNNAIFKSQYQKLIRRDTEFLRFSFMPTVLAPNFGFSIFQNGQGYFDMRQILETGIDAYAFNDLGAALGFAIPMGSHFSVGATVKAIQRTGIDLTLSPSELIAASGQDPNAFLENIYDHLKDMSGTGYGFSLNAGALFRVPMANKATQLFLAATATDIGDTSFSKFGTSPTPPKIRHSYNFGSALAWTLSKQVVWNFTCDLKHQLDSGMPFSKQFHFGTELRHKIFGVRGGVYQGYLTGGFSLEFPPHTRLHFSTYGVEIGKKQLERQHRWYLVQLNIGFNPF